MIYRANSKAWMRSDIFIEWLHNLDNYFRVVDRKILLLIDNAGSHFNSKVLNLSDEENDDNGDDGDDIVAESSHSAQKRNPKLNLLISQLFIYHPILQLTCNPWMPALFIVSKQNTKENFVNT